MANNRAGSSASNRGTSRTDAPALRLMDISKSFGGTRALDGVTFDIRAGSIHGLLGGNGSGKSTLIKTLAGVHPADSGRIQVHGEEHEASRTTPGWARHSGLRFVHQLVGTFPELSVADNFALGSSYVERSFASIRRRTLNRRVRDCLHTFELDVDPRTIIGHLSSATQMMVAVARALQDHETDPYAIMVLDEPTAAMPAHEASILLEALKRRAALGQTIILVSHRLDDMLTAATDVTFLVDGHHAETRPIEGLSRSDLVSRMTGGKLLPPRLSTQRRLGLARLEVRGIKCGPVRDATFNVRRGEIVGISGLLGSGRSTLLRCIFGAVKGDQGSVWLDGAQLRIRSCKQAMQHGIAFVPEDRTSEAIFPDQTVTFNFCVKGWLKRGQLPLLRGSVERRSARDMLRNFGVVAGSERSLISMLSGGNQQKVVMARWLDEPPAVLLLDEPTQGVDVSAREALHGTVREVAAKGSAVLVVTSDVHELTELCDRVVGLSDGVVQRSLERESLTAAACLELAYSDVGAATRGQDQREPANE